LRPSAAPSTAARTTPAAGQTDLARVLNLAEKGDAQAQLQLAEFYRTGRGVARDDQAAIRWYRAAAEKGLAEAQFELGKVYDTGTGGPRDPFEAVRWYRLAAQQGLGRAQYNLGSMHGNGEGVPVDYVKAYVWFSISEATLTGAERETARNAKGQAVQLMNPDDLARAIRLAQRCLTSAYQNCD
jgi:TPR repeat protein